MSVGDRDSVVVTVPDVWQQVFEGEARLRLEAALSDVLKGQRWFGGKARILSATEIVETIPIPSVDPQAILLFVEVAYRDGARETYALPVRLMVGDQAERFAREVPRAVLAHVNVRGAGPDQSGILSDAMWDQAVSQMLLHAIGHGARFPGKAGSLVGSSTTAYPSLVSTAGPLDARVMNAEQSNTSVVFGNHAIMKLYRRLQPGVNPEWEIGRLLTSLTFPYSPAVGGAIEYIRSGGERTTVCLLQAYVRNEGDAWTMTLTALDSFLLRVSAQADGADCEGGKDRSLWELAQMRLAEAERNLIGSTLDAAACLGRRTAALHLALGQPHESPDVAPEPLTREYRQGRYESMIRFWKDTCLLLRQRQPSLERRIQTEVDELFDRERNILSVFQAFLDIQDGGLRIRCHGDYHLGQVLWTGSDYVVTDFEGEPIRPLSERRAKHSPLYDVAGMLRSFDYASWAALARSPKAKERKLSPWTAFWSRWVRAEFLKAYIADAHHASFWPRSNQAADLLLTVHQLEKAIYELAYELNNRPDWMAIPLKGIVEILRMSGSRASATLGQ